MMMFDVTDFLLTISLDDAELGTLRNSQLVKLNMFDC